MLRGKKQEDEVRFELLTWGAALLAAAAIRVVFPKDSLLEPLVLFIPGLILLGAAIFQDMQPDWKAGWPTYTLAILIVATGLTGVINNLRTEPVNINWFIIVVVELGAVLVAKALYDPNPRSRR